MNPVNPVDISDLLARWQPPGGATPTQAQLNLGQALIDDAWEVIVARVPGVSDRLASGDLRSALVVKVVCDMVRPVMGNPDGFLEESIDNWTGRRDAATSTGQMVISDDDLRLLMGGVIRKSFTITPGCSYVC
jgi:hypothetical protein